MMARGEALMGLSNPDGITVILAELGWWGVAIQETDEKRQVRRFRSSERFQNSWVVAHAMPAIIFEITCRQSELGPVHPQTSLLH